MIVILYIDPIKLKHIRTSIASLSHKIEWWWPLLLARLCVWANGGGCAGNRTGPRPPIGAGLYTGLSSLSLDSSWRFGNEPIVSEPPPRLSALFPCRASSRTLGFLAHRDYFMTISFLVDRVAALATDAAFLSCEPLNFSATWMRRSSYVRKL